jgi:hypothetical protein
MRLKPHVKTRLRSWEELRPTDLEHIVDNISPKLAVYFHRLCLIWTLLSRVGLKHSNQTNSFETRQHYRPCEAR